MRNVYFGLRQWDRYMDALTAVMYSLFNDTTALQQVFNLTAVPSRVVYSSNLPWFVNWLNELIFWIDHAQIKTPSRAGELVDVIHVMMRLYFIEGGTSVDSSHLQLTDLQTLVDTLQQVLRLYSTQLSTYENVRIDRIEKLLDTISILLEQCLAGQKVNSLDSNYAYFMNSVFYFLQQCGLNALTDGVPLQCLEFDISKDQSTSNYPFDAKVRVSKANGDNLLQCNQHCSSTNTNSRLDLDAIDFVWPDQWVSKDNTVVSGTDLTAIGVEDVSCVVFGLSGTTFDPTVSSPILSLDLFDTTSQRPSSGIGLSSKSACNAFEMSWTVPGTSLTTSLDLAQEYTVPECVSYYFSEKENNSIAWTSQKCGVVIYDHNTTQCACTQFNLFSVKQSSFATSYSAETLTNSLSLQSQILAANPIPLIVALLLVSCMLVGWYLLEWIWKQDSLPILAYTDSIFPDIRNEMYEQTTLKHVLSTLFSPDVDTVRKGVTIWWHTTREYHLFGGLFLARRHSNLTRSERLLFFGIFVVTMFFLAMMFFATKMQSMFGGTFCNMSTYDVNKDKGCTETWMMFIFSLVSCIPAYWMMGYFLFVRPLSQSFGDRVLEDAVDRVPSELTPPQWERYSSILTLAKLLWNTAQSLKTQLFPDQALTLQNQTAQTQSDAKGDDLSQDGPATSRQKSQKSLQVFFLKIKKKKTPFYLFIKYNFGFGRQLGDITQGLQNDLNVVVDAINFEETGQASADLIRRETLWERLRVSSVHLFVFLKLKQLTIAITTNTI
ncbi:hypothetical protein RFI_05766 [Reticulomyxa filosa]|uniref:Uncharacterized protein n=1 Tax=Reticulomyxa filosa TaxID=46433 RepID=X6NYF8_RETFI|nr:hypothetical protein RFI_05766 [Reticulomyxa filosa]|eukprot:ETO31355.1 hypothetical protein RFI_05766 [Reticulomyxa filosa]